jgi:hypothetical protein
MSDSFNTFDKIELLPDNYNVEYSFDFPACSAVDEADGFLPFGTTLTAVSASVFDESENRVNDLIVGTPSLLNNLVTVGMQYPSGGDGRYQIRFYLNDSAIVYRANFDSIYCKSD